MRPNLDLRFEGIATSCIRCAVNRHAVNAGCRIFFGDFTYSQIALVVEAPVVVVGSLRDRAGVLKGERVTAQAKCSIAAAETHSGRRHDLDKRVCGIPTTVAAHNDLPYRERVMSVVGFLRILNGSVWRAITPAPDVLGDAAVHTGAAVAETERYSLTVAVGVDREFSDRSFEYGQ